MINGLDHANYNQLTGLYDLRATSISTDEISYEEIYTLNNINTNQTIQTQLNNLQSAIANISSLSISGNTLSGVVLLPYLEQYYYNKQNIDDTNTNAYNTMIDIFDNYTTKSSFNSINTLLQNQINSISGNVKYITSTLQGGIRNTVFNSNIKILNVNNTTTNTYISNDPNVTTYFRSDVDMLGHC